MIGELQPKFAPLWTPQYETKDNGDGTTTKILVGALPQLNDDGTQKLASLATFHQLPWPFGPDNSAISKTAYFSLSKGWDDKLNPVSGHVWFTSTSADGKAPVYLGDAAFKLVQDTRKWQWTIPANTDKISIQLDPHAHAIGWCIEVLAK